VLFHFSEDPDIALFTPRPVRVPSRRPPGREWLNGPLVWAIDDWHQPMYLFPRDCPRILIWPTQSTTAEDYDRYWGTCSSRMIAFVERRWMAALHSTAICRYELAPASFESLRDAGMWVSRNTVEPLRKMTIADLPAAIELQNVELRPTDDLLALRHLWATSLHVSGIRLRNAASWSGELR
jgi:hypothetical protein